jgi:hypothetical protein
MVRFQTVAVQVCNNAAAATASPRLDCSKFSRHKSESQALNAIMSDALGIVMMVSIMFRAVLDAAVDSIIVPLLFERTIRGVDDHTVHSIVLILPMMAATTFEHMSLNGENRYGVHDIERARTIRQSILKIRLQPH